MHVRLQHTVSQGFVVTIYLLYSVDFTQKYKSPESGNEFLPQVNLVHESGKNKEKLTDVLEQSVFATMF